MSDLRVALVAEGPTDAIVVEAALKALLPRPFVLSQLQPEPTRPKMGTGWGGVDAWLVAAAFDNDHALLPGLECNLNIEEQLGILPKTQRIKKTRREYLAHEKAVTAAWHVVRQRCTQAERFSTDVAAVLV